MFRPQEQTREAAQTDVASQDIALFKLVGGVLRPYWLWTVLALLLMAVVAGLNVVPPYLLQQAIDGPIARGEVATLWQLSLLYGFTAVASYLITLGYTYFLQMAAQRALADLRSKLFNHIFTQDYAFLNRTPIGELVARLTSDIDTINALLSNSIVVILVEGITLIVIVAVMLAQNWQLALLALSVLPLVTIATRFFRRRIRQSSTGERAALARISSFLNERLHGMTVVQLFGHQEESEEEYDIYNGNYRHALIVLRKHSAVFLSVQEILAAFGMGMILYWGGKGVLAGWATLGVLVAFIQYTDRAFQPILNLSQEYNTIQIALGAAERIYRMLQTAPSIKSPAQPVSIASLRGEIEFNHVKFAYKPEEPVLKDISIRIPAGQALAIVGATGAGKSSMVSLLARYYDPTDGAILLDGIDIRQLRIEELRRLIVVVPQDPVCLEGSIRHNITLFRQDISEEQLHSAAELSNAARFIEQLPGGYDFKVMAGGANLSQGQRQLLALARALAHSPNAVLVLDEATSSIDTATEALIQEALARILRSRTSVVIAHRLSTVRNADRIIVMEKGRIVEEGDHQSLLEKGGYYARLHQHL
ncbi:MAG: ABC transporter ATP-binding protein [Caldilineaceae bacterium]